MVRWARSTSLHPRDVLGELALALLEPGGLERAVAGTGRSAGDVGRHPGDDHAEVLAPDRDERVAEVEADRPEPGDPRLGGDIGHRTALAGQMSRYGTVRAGEHVGRRFERARPDAGRRPGDLARGPWPAASRRPSADPTIPVSRKWSRTASGSRPVIAS